MPEALVFAKKLKFILYIWEYLCYHQKAGVKPDDIIMPLAQLREKAVFQYTTRPYLAIGEFI